MKSLLLTFAMLGALGLTGCSSGSSSPAATPAAACTNTTTYNAQGQLVSTCANGYGTAGYGTAGYGAAGSSAYYQSYCQQLTLQYGVPYTAQMTGPGQYSCVAAY